MADIFWVGRQRTRAQVGTLTVGTASTGGTITVTVGGVRYVVLTPTTTNTTTTAAEIAAACAASTEPEIKEVTWTSAAAVVTFTGPADGRPVTVAKTDGGANATTLVLAATAALSPNDAADGANYSSGSVPAATNRLVFQGDTPDCLWNLDGVTNAISFYRSPTHTGKIGLPDVSDNGYVEYRKVALELNATVITAEMNPGDKAQQLRLKGTSASACTVTVTGPGSQAAVGQELVEVWGLASTSAVRAVGASLAICPVVGQTATVASVTGTSATLTLGAGLTVTTVTLYASAARVLCGWTGLTIDGGSSLEVGGSAAAGTSLSIQGGRVLWRSTGALGAVTVGSGGALDMSACPASVAVTSITILAGGALVNPFDRIARAYTVTLSSAEVGEVGLSIGTGMNFTVN